MDPKLQELLRKSKALRERSSDSDFDIMKKRGRIKHQDAPGILAIHPSIYGPQEATAADVQRVRNKQDGLEKRARAQYKKELEEIKSAGRSTAGHSGSSYQSKSPETFVEPGTEYGPVAPTILQRLKKDLTPNAYTKAKEAYGEAKQLDRHDVYTGAKNLLGKARGEVAYGSGYVAGKGYALGKSVIRNKLEDLSYQRKSHSKITREVQDQRLRRELENRILYDPRYVRANAQVDARRQVVKSVEAQRSYQRASAVEGYESPWQRAQRFANSRNGMYQRARRLTSDTGYAPQRSKGGIRGAQSAMNRAKNYVSKARPVSPQGSYGRSGYEAAMARAKSYIAKGRSSPKQSSGRSGYQDMMARAKAAIRK